MESVWQKSTNTKRYKVLNGDIKTDVLVVGGGIAGILCAYMLKSKGVDCVLIEADRICGGVTANTTAKITVQHGLIYNKIIKKYGAEAAKMYLKAQQKAINFYKERYNKIDCDFKLQDAYVYSTENYNDIEKEFSAYDAIGLKGEFCENIELPVKIKAALRIRNQAQFNPLKFCYCLAEGLNIFENTKAIEVFDGGVITNKGKIYAKNIIITTHFPFINKYGGYFLKMYQHRSYVLALENAPALKGMYVDADIKGLSFREYNGMLLLGGGSHRTGKDGGNWSELRKFAKSNYPNSLECGYWATQDCMTLDGMPYIGLYSKKSKNFYVATGFNKWGITSAAVAAEIISDMVLDKENDYEKIFLPSRSIMHSQIVVNAVESVVGLVTPTVPRCPHLGCALKYNAAEHSWDCSCHGSRFTENGELIENPATNDILIKH